MPDSNTTPGFVSGFVSVLGRPSTGKSTLVNALVGTKVAAVAGKPQVTRNLIQGVLTLPMAQIVFVDTPGIHKPDTLFNRRMLETVREALAERDLLLFVADATMRPGPEDADAVRLVAGTNTPVFLVLNKIDRVKEKALLLPRIQEYQALHDFAEYLPVSALKRDGLDDLRRSILARLPEGPAYFPEDYLTDQPERFLAAELIREQIFRQTQREVPHSAAVLVDEWRETPALTRISATVFVEREGQKAIIIGTKGSMLKAIGTHARLEMERMFGRKVFLEIFVKVQRGWREDPRFLDQLDWRSMAGKSEIE